MDIKSRRTIRSIDQDTGEIIESVELLEGDCLRTKEQLEFFQAQKQRYDDKTDFIWVKFVYNIDFYSKIQAENLTRLMCFASYIKANNYVMMDTDVRETLKINANQKSAFLKELTDQKIINLTQRRLLLNDCYFGKGSIDCDMAYIRLFTKNMQELYESCKSTTEHRHLSYIFRMIPFVNRQTNILCFNQQEQDVNHIIYRTVAEFYSLIGKDTTHVSRFKKNLMKYRINGELVVGFFNTLTELDLKGKYVVINPKLFYGGDRTKQEYTDICSLFETETENI